ncbi:unnamed protein product [Cunninghamella echinulata]
MSSKESRNTGRVKFFNSTKVFVHHSAIHNDGGFKSLCQGEEVAYDLIKGDKGLQATNVTGIDGGSVKGDPRAGKRMPYQQHYPQNNNNQYSGPNQFNSGFAMDPYSSPGYGYAIPNNFLGYGNQMPQGYQFVRPLPPYNNNHSTNSSITPQQQFNYPPYQQQQQ